MRQESVLFFYGALAHNLKKIFSKRLEYTYGCFFLKLLYLRHLISMRKLNVLENIYIRFRSPMLKEDNRPPRPRLRPLLNLFGNHYFSTYIFIEQTQGTRMKCYLLRTQKLLFFKRLQGNFGLDDVERCTKMTQKHTLKNQYCMIPN